MQNSNFDNIISSLDAFIRKYYVNKILKGIILSSALIITWYLIIVIAEYFGHFSTSLRTILFIVTITLIAVVAIIMIIIPLLKIFKIGKVIDYKYASILIGKHFPEIDDKLLNTLELKEMLEKNPEYSDLLQASIKHHSQKIIPVPFLSAVKFKKNIKYLNFLFPGIAVALVFLIFFPSIMTEGTERLLNYDKHYKIPAAFKIILLNDTLQIKKGQDFTVKVKTEGKTIPDNMIINYSGNDFFMEKDKKGNFQYTLRQLNNNIKFSLSALNVKSEEYEIEILPAPIVADYKITVIAPPYTGIEPQTFNNTGDLTVPLGSNVSWTFNTINSDSMSLIFDSVKINIPKIDKSFSITKKVLQQTKYSVFAKNKHFNESFGLNYQINVIPDLFPSIAIETAKDSSQLAVLFFNGILEDDYGFSSLKFVCIPGDKSDTIIKIDIPFAKNTILQEFYFAFDFSTLDVKGKNISYYFEVGDNDGINGPKYSKSEMKEFSIPSAEDIKEITQKNNRDTESKIEEARRINEELQKNIEEFKKKTINEKMNSWERNKNLEQIFNRQQQLENVLDDIKKMQKESLQYKEQFSNKDEIIKKQQEINEMFEKLMDEEMLKMMEEMKKLMDEFKEEDFLKLSEKMSFTFEQMQEEMDNTLELLKKTEVEENFQKISDDLKDLAKEQEKLSKETNENKISKEEKIEKQNEIEKKFKELEKDLKENLEKNKDLQDPVEMENLSEESQKIDSTFQETNQELKSGKNSKASKSQQKNSDQMEEMANKMDSSMESSEMEQEEENIEDLRRLIKNLLFFSFSQEDIMSLMSKINSRDPRFKEQIIRQKNLIDDFQIIRDSLNSLSSRIPMLGQFVSKEIFAIYDYSTNIMDDIFANQKSKVSNSQQNIMASSNKIILILLEMMQQMQQDMGNQQQKEGGQCKNCQKGSKSGKKGKGKMGEMRDMQQGLKRQMQEMLQNMKDGKKKGEKPGGRNSEEIAKMLMQQEMLKQMLSEEAENMSPEAAKILKQIEQMMDQNISDLINGNISQQTINRQDQILTRLLQAENSDRERETDNKRKSNEAKDYKISNPSTVFQDKEKEQRFKELMQFSNIKLTPFYKNRYKDYIKNL